VTWKVAATLDGRIADASGRSRWITSAASRRHVHRLRAEADAIVVGAGTAAADDPRLTARGPRVARQPLRIVLDTTLSLPHSLKLFGRSLARGTVVVCSQRASGARERALRARGVDVWRLPASRSGIAPATLLRRLAREGRHEVLLECGPGLGTPWLRANVVDRMAVFVAPRLLGGDGRSWLDSLGERPLEEARAGRLLEQRRFGDDAYLLVEVAR
jgi:diaminohydroxyphosphoribosylaminopyrimidine deaminase/5-amino-6-(5-phosphoribosylamino)uracil reductase